MTPVFLDTSGLVAVVNTDDQWHADAESVWRQLFMSQRPLISTSLVLIELADGLSRIRHRALAIKIRDRLRATPRIRIIQATAGLDERAWELFRQRTDKEWGMTDCVSIIVMQDEDVTDVLSSDHHFEQAGLNILLKR